MKYKYRFFEDAFDGIKFINRNKFILVSVVRGSNSDINNGFFKWFFGLTGYLFIFKLKRKRSKKMKDKKKSIKEIIENIRKDEKAMKELKKMLKKEQEDET